MIVVYCNVVQNILPLQIFTDLIFGIFQVVYIENTRWVILNQVYQASFWEFLMTSRGLLSDSNCVLKAKPGKLDIKRRKPGILFISLAIVSLFKLAIMT